MNNINDNQDFKQSLQESPKTALLSLTVVKQTTFINRHQGTWQKFDELCQKQGINFDQINPLQPQKNASLINQTTSQTKSQSQTSTSASYLFIKLYRQICQHYALAKQRHYSPQLVEQLHQRVMIGHQLIYQSKLSYFNQILNFIFYGFPAQLRKHKRLFWLSFALFYMPLIIMLIGCYLNNELIYSVMSADQVSEMEYMYNPANATIGRAMNRQADSDIMMFGVYISNNIGIDFRMYASGLFAGIGTIISTLYNGVVIGAVAGHLTRLGYGHTFWSFVCGHSSFELTAAIIAGAAGLRLAQPIISPFPYKRKDAFIVAGKQSIQLLLGAALLTLIAAFIEAFWSSSRLIPNEVKYAVALLLWTLVTLYLSLAGRSYLVINEPTEKNLSANYLKNKPPTKLSSTSKEDLDSQILSNYESSKVKIRGEHEP